MAEEYALNKIKDIWHYDPARLLDLGNDFQVVLSQNNDKLNEEARAHSNFQKVVEGEKRPISHTLVDASRLIPDLLGLLLGKPTSTILKNMFSKKMTSKTGNKIARTLARERTSDAAEALFKGAKYKPRDAKDMAGKKWVRDLLENTDAMERVAGRELTPKEIKAVREALPEHVAHQIEKFNASIGPVEKGMSASKLNPDRVLKNIKTTTSGKDKLKAVSEYLKPNNATTFFVLDKGLVAANKIAENQDDPNKSQAILKPNYYIAGSAKTPALDAISTFFNTDYNDPSRFNKADIDEFFNFLEKEGIIEPGIKDKWTPRQKVSVMRNLMSEDYGKHLVRDRWLEYKNGENK